MPYIPLDHFQETDDDLSSVRIRDMPYGKFREALSIYPPELIFPLTVVNTQSASHPIIITNVGYDIVLISEIKVVGDFFSNTPYPGVLAPGESISMQVVFTPKRTGTITGGLYINSGNAAGQEFVPLSGSTDDSSEAQDLYLDWTDGFPGALRFPITQIMREAYINVRTYCGLDDTKDTSASIAAAIADSYGATIVFRGPLGGNYNFRVLDRINAHFNLENNSRFIIEGNATIDFSSIKKTGIRQQFFNGSNPLSLPKTPLTNLSAGSNSFSLSTAEAADIKPGDYLSFKSTKLFIAGGQTPQGEINRVHRKSGDTIILTSPFRDTYLLSDTISCFKIDPFKFELDGLGKIIGPGRWDTGAGDTGFCVEFGIGRVGRIEFINCDYNQLRLENAIDVIVEGTRFSHDAKGTNENVQYSVSYMGATDSLRIRDCVVHGGKHGIVDTGLSTTGGVARDVEISGNQVYGTWHAAFVTHGEAEDIVYHHNLSDGCELGFDHRIRRVRSFHNKIINPSMIGSYGIGIMLGDRTEDFLSENDLVRGGRYGIRLGAFDEQLAGSLGPIDVKIHNFTAENQSVNGIELVYDDTTNSKKNLEIIGLKAINYGALGFGIEGPFTQVILKDITMERLTSGGCGTTTGVTSVYAENFKLGDNVALPVLGGSRVYARNIVGWNDTTVPVRSINAGETVSALYSDFVTVSVAADNVGTTDELKSITISSPGARITFMATTGQTIIIKNAGAHVVGIGNIRTLSGSDVTITGNLTASFACDGVLWYQY